MENNTHIYFSRYIVSHSSHSRSYTSVLQKKEMLWLWYKQFDRNVRHVITRQAVRRTCAMILCTHKHSAPARARKHIHVVHEAEVSFMRQIQGTNAATEFFFFHNSHMSKSSASCMITYRSQHLYLFLFSVQHKSWCMKSLVDFNTIAVTLLVFVFSRADLRCYLSTETPANAHTRRAVARRGLKCPKRQSV